MSDGKVGRMLSGFFFGAAAAFFLITFETDAYRWGPGMIIVVMLGLGAFGAGFQAIWYDFEMWTKSKAEADSKKEPPF